MIQFEFWHWWALGLVLVVIEGMVPAGVFASMAIASGIVGAIFLIDPETSWQMQLGVFASITLVLTLIFSKIIARRKAALTESGEFTAHEMKGKEFELERPIQTGFGDMEIDGFHWSLKGPDAAAGTKVRVIGVDGHMLVVVPVAMAEMMKNQEQSDLK